MEALKEPTLELELFRTQGLAHTTLNQDHILQAPNTDLRKTIKQFSEEMEIQDVFYYVNLAGQYLSLIHI